MVLKSVCIWCNSLQADESLNVLPFVKLLPLLSRMSVIFSWMQVKERNSDFSENLTSEKKIKICLRKFLSLFDVKTV